jgi:hypothetical protein
MRTFVHLVLFACAIAMAVGAFGPFVDSVEARHVRFVDLRDGFEAGRSLNQIGSQAMTLQTSLTLVLLITAAVMLLAALTGLRSAGAVAVLAGLVALGLLAWRLDQRFDHQLRTDYQHLLTGAWGLYLFGGGVVVALLALLVPRERTVPATVPSWRA